MTLVDLPLTPAQVRKLTSGKRVRLSKHHLSADSTVKVNVSQRMANKIKRRMISGKGFHLGNEWDKNTPMEGGGVRAPFKKLGKVIRGAAKTIKREAPGVAKQAAHATGRVAQQAKKYVPRQAIKGAVKGLSIAATTAIGQPQLAPLLTKAINPAVDAAYETNLAHGSVGKNFGRSYAKNLVRDGTNSLFTMG